MIKVIWSVFHLVCPEWGAQRTCNFVRGHVSNKQYSILHAQWPWTNRWTVPDALIASTASILLPGEGVYYYILYGRLQLFGNDRIGWPVRGRLVSCHESLEPARRPPLGRMHRKGRCRPAGFFRPWRGGFCLPWSRVRVMGWGRFDSIFFHFL
jgi:hypothetical protein